MVILKVLNFGINIMFEQNTYLNIDLYIYIYIYIYIDFLIED